MAKFPTEVDESVTIAAPRQRVYAYLWDVVGASRCVPDLATCERVGPDTYHFVSRERSAGPVSMVARYTARYEGNGVDTIRFESLPNESDNTDVRGDCSRGRSAGRHAGTLHANDRPGYAGARLVQGLIGPSSSVKRRQPCAVPRQRPPRGGRA
jgi:hypothetical protein